MRGGRALDCGAGIGRVTKHLLLEYFDIVDVLDQCHKYVAAAREYIASDRVGQYLAVGLQEFRCEVTYNCVWAQWVLAHLTDDDLVAFLRRLRDGLSASGVVVVKENVKSKGFHVDKDDSSVTRSDSLFKRAFRDAGLEVIREELQVNFPQDLYKVKMYALRFVR